MELMDEETAKKVRESLDTMVDPVHVIIFVNDKDCQYCGDTISIVKEVSGLSERLTYEVKGPEEAKSRGIDKYPALIVMKGTPEQHTYTGVRFFGIPAGYEFTSLLDAIMSVSKGESVLSQEARDELKRLDKDVHLQVFVTPTCPYCPRAVVLAHHMALVSDRVTADMVEATEFQELAIKYQVMGVPKTVINERYSQEGAAPERMIMDLIRKAVK